MKFSPLRLGSIAENWKIKNRCGCKGINWDYITGRAMGRSWTGAGAMGSSTGKTGCSGCCSHGSSTRDSSTALVQLEQLPPFLISQFHPLLTFLDSLTLGWQTEGWGWLGDGILILKRLHPCPFRNLPKFERISGWLVRRSGKGAWGMIPSCLSDSSHGNLLVLGL